MLAFGGGWSVSQAAAARPRTVAAVTDRLHLADGTAAVLDSLRRSLAGAGVTAPLPADPAEREQTLAMLRPEAPVEETDAAAVVATSGSTGRPRGVVLSQSALIASAEATHRRLGGPGRWVLALPAHYVAGLMVLVRSLVADRPVLAVDGRLDTLAALDLTGGGPHYLSVVPTQLIRALADPARTAALRRFEAVLLGGSAADPALLDRAAVAGIRVVTTYGMSETCGGCVYDGRPLDGVSVDLEFVDAVPGGPGRVVLSGPVVARGYRGRPRDAAFAVPGSFVTGDLGAWSDDRLQVLGRVDDVIVTGGLKVAPQQVEAVIVALPGVAAAVVVGLPDEQWGEVVTAVVVPTDPDFDPEAIRRLSSLAPHQRPRRIELVRAIPERGPGKPDRRAIRDSLMRAAPRPDNDHPRAEWDVPGP